MSFKNESLKSKVIKLSEEKNLQHKEVYLDKITNTFPNSENKQFATSQSIFH